MRTTQNAKDDRSSESPAAATRVLVVDADRALYGLLEEWLSACGLTVMTDNRGQDPIALVIADVPFPRQGGIELVQRIEREHPGAPVLALSSCFFASTPCRGDVARALGVASVLPKPVTREALISAVRSLLPH